MTYKLRKLRMQSSLPGVTLIELMASLAISAIIITAAITVGQSVYEFMRVARIDNQKQDELAMLHEFLGTELMQLGGGAVRPWQVIGTSCDDGTAYLGTDTCPGTPSRLDFLSIRGDQCVLSSAGPNIQFDTTGGGTCCLSDILEGDTGSIDIALVPRESDGGWIAGRCTPDIGSCACNGFAAVGFQMPAQGVSTYNGGTATRGSVTTVRLDGTRLVQNHDVDEDGAVDELLLADEISDFQIRLGYDLAGDDGRVETWTKRIDDEENALRMLRLGIIAEYQTPRAPMTTAQLFDEPVYAPAAGTKLRKRTGKFALRALGILQ